MDIILIVLLGTCIIGGIGIIIAFVLDCKGRSNKMIMVVSIIILLSGVIISLGLYELKMNEKIAKIKEIFGEKVLLACKDIESKTRDASEDASRISSHKILVLEAGGNPYFHLFDRNKNLVISRKVTERLPEEIFATNSSELDLIIVFKGGKEAGKNVAVAQKRGFPGVYKYQQLYHNYIKIWVINAKKGSLMDFHAIYAADGAWLTCSDLNTWESLIEWITTRLSKNRKGIYP